MDKLVAAVILLIAYIALSAILGSVYVVANAIQDRPAQHQGR